jgi:uncharacterized membrane protein YraQ (UPF0718 family)
LIVGFFGLKGFVFVVSAVFIAIVTGLIFLGLEGLGVVETNPNTVKVDGDFSIIEDMKRRYRKVRWGFPLAADFVRGSLKGAVSLANMVMWWILIGVILSSLIGTYIPTEWMAEYMGNSTTGLFVTLAAATIMEVCSEGTAPLAFEIFLKTGALGNSFIFLMAGVVTDYTEIGILWTNVGRRTAIWLPVITVPQVVALGALYNVVF